MTLAHFPNKVKMDDLWKILQSIQCVFLTPLTFLCPLSPPLIDTPPGAMSALSSSQSLVLAE